ncbi:hypothetical protein ACM66B_002288 [Microbotryomycetes sp. NB124-2]
MSVTRQRADALFNKYLLESVPSLLELSVRLAFASSSATDSAASAATHALELVFQIDQTQFTNVVREDEIANVDPRKAFKLASIELVNLETVMTSLGLPSNMPATIFKQKVLDAKSVSIPSSSSSSNVAQHQQTTFNVVAFAVPASIGNNTSEPSGMFSLTKLLKIDLSVPLDDDNLIPFALKTAISRSERDSSNQTVHQSQAGKENVEPAWRRIAAQAWLEPWYEAGSKVGHRDVGIKAVTELAVLRTMEREQMTDEERQAKDEELQKRVTRHLLRRADEMKSQT